MSEDSRQREIKVYGKERIKKKTKIIFIILVLIIALIIAGIPALWETIKEGESSYKEGDKSNVPYAYEQYTTDVKFSNNGEIEASMTAQELWDLIISNGGNINKYLNNPSELKKMMNAQLVTQFMDTRSNPDEPIDWDSINADVNSNDIQGIVKLKRGNADGTTTTMTYVDEAQYNFYIRDYLDKGTEETKKEALSHFTIEENKTVTYGNGTSTSNISAEEFLQAVRDVAAEVYQNRTQYIYGHSTTIPPCELEADGKKHISCDRIASRALYNLGFTDQPAGGITCLMPGVENWLEAHGFVRINDQSQLQRRGYSFYRNAFADCTLVCFRKLRPFYSKML